MADELSPGAGPECQVQAAAVSKRRERSLLALGSSSRPPALGGSESDVEAGWAVRVLDPSWCLLLLRSCVAVFLASMCFCLVFALSGCYLCTTRNASGAENDPVHSM